MSYNIDKLTEVSELLNKLTSILSQDLTLDAAQESLLNNLLNRLNKDDEELETLTSFVNNLEDDYVTKPDPEIPQILNETFYGIGETCLLLDPFDNYRMFNLYLDADQKTPLDLSDGQTIYLVFRNGSKEVRIKEYTEYGGFIEIDKEHGQVLFKINRKQISEIFNLKNREFYITRIYESYDPTTDSIISSDEEVIYSGFWGERNTTKKTNLQETIDQLRDLLNQRTAAMEQMIKNINKLIDDKVTLSEEINNLKSQLEQSEVRVNELESMLGDIAPGILEAEANNSSGYKAELLDSRTILINYDNIDDNEIKEKLDQLTGTQLDEKEQKLNLMNQLNNSIRL